VTVLQSSWFSALENRSFAMIVSNPPYIDEHDPHLAQGMCASNR
jgi:release factor glutamine methyltransferase